MTVLISGEFRLNLDKHFATFCKFPSGLLLTLCSSHTKVITQTSLHTVLGSSLIPPSHLVKL